MSTAPFFQVQPLRLTPLTPIHIGCGIDFEPTNYVIDEGVLYHFDPARVPLPGADRKALMDAANAQAGESVRRVQAFFHERRQRYAAAAHQLVAVAAGVAQQYAHRVGRIAQREGNGADVNNQLVIERSVHHPHTGALYLPGTSLKGAMRTAWLDQLNEGRPLRVEDRNANALEKRLLEGAFHTDPLRLLDVLDASGEHVQGKVYFATNHKKKQVFKHGQELTGRGPTTRRETLVGGQHAALHAEWRLDALPGQARSDKVPRQRFTLDELADACNAYYLPRLRELLRVLEARRFADAGWILGLRELLSALAPAMARREVFLLRVGRHSGAESVTLDGVRRISIMQGPGQRAIVSEDGATTVWLAAEQEHGPMGTMLPFGWLLVERGDAPDLPELRAWCERQPKTDMQALHQRWAGRRAQAQQEAQALAQEAAQRQAQEQAAREAEQARQAALATLSPQMREVEALRDKLTQRQAVLRGGKDKPNTALHGECRILAKRALAEAWPSAERHALASLLEALLPVLIQSFDWKDERKRLQVSLLREP